MKRFILNIYNCDRPIINIESLIELINKSEVASEIEVLQRVADKLTAKLTDGTPGSIQFIWRVVDVSTIDTKECRTGYLNYTVNKEESFKTAGVCLFATNINSEIKGDNTGDCSITEEHILNSIVAAVNFANSLEELNTKDSFDDFYTEVQRIKELRKDIDDVIQKVKTLESCREVSICITKLQEAVMWLGMDLKRLNEPNPYPSSKDPSTGDRIEPTADNLKF